MTNITERVHDYLRSDVMLSHCLALGVANLRGLARHIVKEAGLSDRDMQAVLSAIRRYRNNRTESAGKRRKIFQGIAIRTKDDVIDTYLKKTKHVQEKLGEFKRHINVEQGDMLRIIQAERGIRLLIDRNALENFRKTFDEEDVISVDEDLAEVNLQFTGNAGEAPGIVAMLTSSLNATGVNLVEIMSCAPELILIIDAQDLTRTLEVINSLKKL